MSEAVALPPTGFRFAVQAWRVPLDYPMATIGAFMCLVIVLGAVLAPWIAPYDPLDQNIIARLSPPDGSFLFGTDAYGRDVLSRILWGARISLVVAVSSIAAAIVVGGTIGMISGYVGGRTDLLIMQVMDVMLSFPSLILGLIVMALLGPSMGNLVFAIALTAIAPFARIARAPVLSLKERAYVEAGRALGFSATCGSSSCTSCQTSSPRCW